MSEIETTDSVSEASEALVTPQLRREALLPTERTRGLGTVAIVCTMAGVASGLALATTLMAMQVADSMSTRPCPYHQQESAVVLQGTPGPGRAYLGIVYQPVNGTIEIDHVMPRTPASRVDIHPGDHLLSIDGVPVHSIPDMRQQIYQWHRGQTPSLVIEREGTLLTLHPTLMAWPGTH